ncbi:MAG: ABC transporter substrate-binding protein [Ruminococcus sp.]|nr:ABC transporter substrate-binding protein [Ruminococcus sp.]
MKKLKEIIYSFVAVTLSAVVFSCGEKGENSVENDVDPAVRQAIAENAQNSDYLTGELENKTIKWLATWDMNAYGGKSTPAFLVAFQERYGGKIEWHQCTHEERYEQLAKSINAGEGIDFFYAGDLDAFPRGVLRSMFVPADDYIDFDSPLWEDVSKFNNNLMWKGSHYVAVPMISGDNCAVIYNRKTVREAGLQDPAELYKNGEWTWDVFKEMLEKFVDNDSQRYGIDGYWFEFGLMNTTGIAPVGIADGRLINNIGSPSMERVQNFIYSLYSEKLIAIGSEDYGWSDKPSYIGSGKTLFYPCGLYQFYKKSTDWKSVFGDDVFFVPMPKDPSADEYYIPVGMEGYTFVKGGQNPEGVGKFLDCKRFVLKDPETKAIADKQMVDDYGWTEEMMQMKDEMQKTALENPVVDLSKGVSVDCGDLLDISLRLTARGTPWAETYDSINAVVDKYIDEVNAQAE